VEFGPIVAAAEPILPGLVTAAFFLLTLVAGRIVLRHDVLAEKLHFPSTLLSLYLVLLIGVVVTHLYWEALSEVMAIVASLVLALAVVLAAAVAVVDLFLGRARNVQVPAIIRDILVIMVYVITIFVVLGQRGVDLTSILTTSAVLTAIIGFALQDLLSNIIAGLALQIEHPFTVGDWVKFDEQEGEVLEINWRSTKIKTLHHDVVIIPNNVITRSAVINFTAPSRIHRRKLTLGLRYEAPPNQIKASILRALRDVEGVLVQPEPFVLLKSYDDFSIAYRIHFFIDEFHLKERIESRVRSRLWYQLKRDGFSIPFPIRDINVHQISPEDEREYRERERVHVTTVLQKVPFLEPLSDEAWQRLARGVTREHFAAQETIIRQHAQGDSFYVIAEGEVSVRVGDELREVARLRHQEFFGEMSLMTGERRSATVVAETDCELYCIDKATFQRIIVAEPDLISAISDKLEARRSSLTANQSAEEDGANEGGAQGGGSLVNRIRRFFNLAQ
jgi:small-conductance mechanosensitive channel/CRP-like cAMP-binding protein